MSARALFRWLGRGQVPVLWAALLVPLAALSCAPSLSWGQAAEPASNSPRVTAAVDDAAASTSTEPPPLATRQDAVSMRYRRFETTLLQLTEYLRKTDPDRAELLDRALGKSKESRIPDQFSELVQLLERGQLGDAIDAQLTVAEQMQGLLALLQSEDRQSELEREQQRLQALVRDVDRLISRQTDARATAERGGAPERAMEQQQRVAKETQDVVDKIRQQDASRSGKPGEQQQEGSAKEGASAPEQGSQEPQDAGKGEPAPKPPGKEGDSPDQPADPSKDADAKDPQQEPSGEKPKKPSPGKEEQPDGAKPSKGSEGGSSGKPKSAQSPSESKPQDGGSQPSESPEGPPPSDMPPEGGDSPPAEKSEAGEQGATPGREELRQARQQMERAIKELREQKSAEASKEQDRALAELLKAKEKLEEILRQMREEEQELLLAALEARFRDMLGRQINIYNGTLGLAAVPVEQRTDRQRSRAIELARSQDEVSLLAAKALTLLKEEGSSIAFPEAVVQIRDDMLTSARLLERVEIGELTQAIQKDIVESLEEILDSLQKELEKSKDRKQQQGQQGQQEQQTPALVDALAELKMLRSLQYRINRRTKQVGRLVDGEQATEADVIQQLRELSVRQSKIQRTAYDLATGRNQ